MNAAENLHLIDRYLRKELSGEELQLFEQRLKNDPLFLREVELQKKTILLIKENEILSALKKAQQNITDKGTFKNWPHLNDFKEAMADRVYSKRAPEPRLHLLKSARSPINNLAYTIPYEGDPNPPFPVKSLSKKLYFLYLAIKPGSELYHFHYQFTLISNKQVQLTLYGNYNLQELTLLYYKKENSDVIKLRIKSKDYLLQLNQPIAPLLEDDSSS